ncbi:hypothetical protein GGR53DRAFT_462694 [Hypoxylon sp. FL1150]|nr:hypothetical protein GGR53DRAFT_462694 [Hypoxylon sp. FL1150]
MGPRRSAYRLTGTRTCQIRDNENNYLTGTSISVKASDSLIRDNQCIGDWQTAYVESNDSVPVDPDYCNKDLDDGWRVWASIDSYQTVDFSSIDYPSNSDILLTVFDGTELFAWADTEENHDDGGELYADSVRDVWLVMTVYSSTSSEPSPR